LLLYRRSALRKPFLEFELQLAGSFADPIWVALNMAHVRFFGIF
jgi:hypothetical protein